MAGVHFEITASNEDLIRKLRESRQAILDSGRTAEQQGNKINQSFEGATKGASGLNSMLLKIGGTAALTKLVSDVIRVRGEFQQLDVAFTTLLQSKEKANALMAQMVETAAKTPFNLTELATGARQLVAYGFQAEEINGTLVRLGNIASGLGLPLERLTYLYGTTMTQGRLYTRDLMQFTTSGIPMLQGLADMYGVSTAKINEMVTAGKIGFPEVQKVIENMTNEGGKFFNLMEEQSKTITGKISNLGDAMDGMFNSIGQANEGIINDSIDGLKYLVENYEQVGRILLGLVATYGTYKVAVMLAAATSKGYTVAQLAQYGALILVEKAQKTLNLAVLQNPYVIAAVALVSIVSAMWAFRDSTTAAEKAQNDFNASKEEAIKREEAHKSHIEKLISTIQDETTAEMNRIGAMEQLKAAYPHIFSKYIDEKGHLRDIIGYKKEIAEFDAKVSVGIAKRQADRAKQELTKVNAEIDYRQGSRTGASKFFRNKTTSELREMQAGLLKSYQLKQAEYDKLSALDKKASDNPITKTKNKEYWEGQKKEADKALSEIDSKQRALLNAGKFDKVDSKVVANYKEQKRLIAEAEKELKAYPSTSDTTKQDKAADKLRQEQEKYNLLLNKQALDQSRSAEDLQNQVDQTRINAMDEGSKKTLAQMELNFEKEMQAIDRQKEDLLHKKIEDERAKFDKKEDENAAKDPKYKKQTFDPVGITLSDGENKQFDELYKAQIAEKEKEEKAYLDNLLEKHQDYTDKRLAIEKKFNADIAALDEQRKKAVENGDTKQVEEIDRAKAQATKDKGKELMGMDYDKLKESPDYVRAFENLKETSSETLNSLLSQLENAKGAAAKVLSPDQLREYTTTIQEIMDELDARNPFQSLSDKKQELADAEQELADAQMALENARQTADAVKGGAQIENGVKSSKFNEKTGKIDSTKAYLTEAQALDRVKNKTNEYNKAKDNVVKADAKVKKAEKDVKGQIDELSNAMSDLGSAIGGQAGEIISLIGDIGSFTMFAMEGIKAAADTSANAISTVEKASVILAIISAAVQVATKIAKLFKGEDEEEQRKKRLEFYNDIIAIYDKIIDKQKESIKFGYGFASIQAAKEAMENLNKQTEYYRKISSDNATNLMFKSGSLYSYKKALSDLGIKADFKDLIKTDELSNLSSKQLEHIRDNYKELWASLKDEQRDALQAIIDAEEKSKEIVDGWKESITGISYDSFYTEFIDTLSDMDSSAEDMANNFGEYLKKSILAAMVAKEFQGKIDNLYEMWAAAGKEESDGGIDITKQEAEDLQKRQKELTEAMIKRREEMEKTYGWESSESSSQDSTQKGFAAMSQDTGNELNGRFTALQISNEEIKNTMLLVLGNLSALSATSVDNNGILSDMRNLAVMSNSYLEDIAGFQKKIVGILSTDLGEIKQKIKNM